MVLGKYEIHEVIGPGIWNKEIQISGFSEMMMNYGNKMVFNFE